jgi:hypothetical protein
MVEVNSMGTDGTVQVTYTSEGSVGGLDPGTLAAAIRWNPQATVPPGAPEPPALPPPGTAPLTGGTCVSATSSIVCTFPFPASLQDSGYLLNGTYQVTASASDCPVAGIKLGCVPGTAPAQNFSVANPATPPAGKPKATLVAGSTSMVTISWAPSPEPDVVGYQVFRADGSFACSLSTFPAPSDYSCVDSPPADGSYAYHVVAHRWGPTYSKDVGAEPASAASSPSNSVSVTGTAANVTTTTVAGGGATTLGPPGFTATKLPNISPKSSSGTGNFKASPNPAAALPATPTTADPGFNPLLPYQRTTTSDPGTTDPAVIAAPPLTPKKSSSSIGTIAVVGAGLLVAVIALHGLWLRGEVRRSGALEVLEPER